MVVKVNAFVPAAHLQHIIALMMPAAMMDYKTKFDMPESLNMNNHEHVGMMINLMCLDANKQAHIFYTMLNLHFASMSYKVAPGMYKDKPAIPAATVPDMATVGVKLNEVLSKINDCTTRLWDNESEFAYGCVALEEVDNRYDDEGELDGGEITAYNGWLQDLEVITEMVTGQLPTITNKAYTEEPADA